MELVKINSISHILLLLKAHFLNIFDSLCTLYIVYCLRDMTKCPKASILYVLIRKSKAHKYDWEAVGLPQLNARLSPNISVCESSAVGLHCKLHLIVGIKST